MFKKIQTFLKAVGIFAIPFAVTSHDAFAQATTTPGAPVTGVAGDALLNVAILSVSLLIIGAGALYVLWRDRKHTRRSDLELFS
jgi:hypothetical protein